MCDRTDLSRRIALAGLFASLLLAIPSLPTDVRAEGADELVNYLPGDSRFAARIDVDALRGTQYFDRAIEFLEERAKQDDSVPDVLDSSAAFDPRSDLHGVAVGLPVSRISPSQNVQRAVVAVSADFQESDFAEYLEQQFSDVSTHELDSGSTVYETDGRAFVVPTSNRLVAVLGPESYRNKVWGLLDGEGTSFSKVSDRQGLLTGIDTSRMIWMVNRIPNSGSGGSSKARSAAVGIQLASRVDLQMVTVGHSESDAESMSKRVKSLKETWSENRMLKMMGAGPLVTNLEVERNGSRVTATTSMTDSEFDYFVDRVRQLSEGQSKLSIPSGGAEESTSEDSDDSD